MTKMHYFYFGNNRLFMKYGAHNQQLYWPSVKLIVCIQ